MELTFKELQKREVININDGQSFGRITDVKLSFPKGILTGIYVPGRRGGFLSRLFDRSQVFIEEKKIVKIGSDAILVDLGRKDHDNYPSPRPLSQVNKCPNNCPPPCPPPCPPQRPPCANGGGTIDLSDICDANGRIDLGDYQ